jgi:methylated-DNA-protein-cysteine methyltransferase-like protein
MEELWDLIRAIPPGKVATYGGLGATLKHPASGFIVGRWMARCPNGVPWWRVVAKTGSLPIAKLDIYAELDQRRQLESEGVGFVGDKVDLDAHLWDLSL